MIPDVARLVDAVRQDVNAARERGEFTPEDIEVLVDERLRAYIAEARIDDKLAARLLHESQRWNIDPGYAIRSRQPGLAGAVVPLAKRIVRPFVRVYTDQILNRQAQLNLVTWQFLRDSIRRTLLLELEVKQLRRDVDQLTRER